MRISNFQIQSNFKKRLKQSLLSFYFQEPHILPYILAYKPWFFGQILIKNSGGAPNHYLTTKVKGLKASNMNKAKCLETTNFE